MPLIYMCYDIMVNLTIRGLPEEIHASLKERARRNRRSLNQEVIEELAAGTVSDTEDMRAAVAWERMLRAIEKTEKMRAGHDRGRCGRSSRFSGRRTATAGGYDPVGRG